jgi:hypothetical protein
MTARAAEVSSSSGEGRSEPVGSRLAGVARRGPVDTAAERIVGALVGPGLDVAPVHADGRGAEEPFRFGLGVVGDLHEPDIRVEAELGHDLPDERCRRLVMRTALEVEDLDDLAWSLRVHRILNASGAFSIG